MRTIFIILLASVFMAGFENSKENTEYTKFLKVKNSKPVWKTLYFNKDKALFIDNNEFIASDFARTKSYTFQSNKVDEGLETIYKVDCNKKKIAKLYTSKLMHKNHSSSSKQIEYYFYKKEGSDSLAKLWTNYSVKAFDKDVFIEKCVRK
ncbi:hypothetical protein A7M79_01270 [Acinetobacter baumannii]|nr:hypothetical protein A7M79_01270 [Acinetobacter baumannii]